MIVQERSKFSTMLPQDKPDWVAEETLAEQLNIPREVIAEARELLPAGVTERDGHFVYWQKNAAGAYAAALGLEWPAPEKTAAPEEAELTVASAPGAAGRHFPNPRMIRARKPDGVLVDVLVIRAAHFTPTLRDGTPMKFLARKSPHGPHWQLVGREPRGRGQW